MLLRISKFLFTAIAYAHIMVVGEALKKDSGKDISNLTQHHSYALTLQQAIQHIPHTYYENVIRNIALKLGQSLGSHAINHMPDIKVVCVIKKICWAAAIGDISLLQNDTDEIHKMFETVRIQSFNCYRKIYFLCT